MAAVGKSSNNVIDNSNLLLFYRRDTASQHSVISLLI
jgi:hypothetical protein